MIDEIRALSARYCELMDAGDFDEVGQLFAQGALLDPDGNELARGAEAVAAFYRQIVLLHNGYPRTKHHVFETRVDGERVTSVYLVLQDGRPIVAGRYHDRVEHTADGWRFAERRFFVDLVGDVSRHLTYEIRGRSSSGTG